MFTNIDFELYPECCEVAFLPLHNQWVYMIQKNGTSSIRRDEKTPKRILVNEEIGSLEFVDIYIRDPQTRYLSGINTFVQHLRSEHPTLDQYTLLWMASKYLFLNRHYLPQLLWIINLTRYLGKDTIMRFHNFEDFGKLVTKNDRAKVLPMPDDEKQFVLSCSSNGPLELWLFADQILKNLSNCNMTWRQVKEHYRSNHANIWNEITKTVRTFQHVLS